MCACLSSVLVGNVSVQGKLTFSTLQRAVQCKYFAAASCLYADLIQPSFLACVTAHLPGPPSDMHQQWIAIERLSQHALYLFVWAAGCSDV